MTSMTGTTIIRARRYSFRGQEFASTVERLKNKCIMYRLIESERSWRFTESEPPCSLLGTKKHKKKKRWEDVCTTLVCTHTHSGRAKASCGAVESNGEHRGGGDHTRVRNNPTVGSRQA